MNKHTQEELNNILLAKKLNDFYLAIIENRDVILTDEEYAEMLKEFIGGLTQMNFEEIATQKNVSNNSNNIDFQDVESIKNAIIEVQAEYKQKGINLQSSEAMDIVRKRGDK